MMEPKEFFEVDVYKKNRNNCSPNPKDLTSRAGILIRAPQKVSFKKSVPVGLTKTLSFFSRAAQWLTVIQSSIQAVASAAREDWKNMFLNSAAAIGALMAISGGIIKTGVSLEISGIGFVIGTVLLWVGTFVAIAAVFIQAISLLENQTEKLCRTILIEDKNDGGCNKFAQYKNDFKYGESNTVRGLKYNKKEFGNDINVIDRMVERVVNFVKDYNTYDLY